MNIGIVCYASVGGSGVVGTELAHALALRGHRVHLISSEVPFRWRHGLPGLAFERVETPAYPLFREPQYLLALANTIVRVACERKLDLVHAHYAVPHATAAYLADQILASGRDASPAQTVTTLHGTDITLVGSDPSYRRVVAFSIEQSSGVTAVSESLRRETVEMLGIRQPIRVIPNFIDTAEFRRSPDPELKRRLSPDGAPILMHMSNFRPVKRVEVVYEVFRGVMANRDAHLVLVGDGPDRPALERRVAEDGLQERVRFVGEQLNLPAWLSAADVFLLPSAQESFGMAAVEAMACEVPVIASRVGGLPEVIAHGETGFLFGPDDVDGMVEQALRLAADPAAAARLGAAACESVHTRYNADAIVPLYEAFYREVLKAPRKITPGVI
jgi:N-acetyl-alpha-D-glucosaminyl L-malate synthase BshA